MCVGLIIMDDKDEDDDALLVHRGHAVTAASAGSISEYCSWKTRERMSCCLRRTSSGEERHSLSTCATGSTARVDTLSASSVTNTCAQNSSSQCHVYMACAVWTLNTTGMHP